MRQTLVLQSTLSKGECNYRLPPPISSENATRILIYDAK